MDISTNMLRNMLAAAAQNQLNPPKPAPQPTPSVSVNLSPAALAALSGYPASQINQPGAINTPGLSGYPGVNGHVPGAPHLEYTGDNGACIGAIVAALGSVPAVAQNPSLPGILSWATGAASGIAGGCIKVVPDAGHGGDGHGVSHSESHASVSCSAPHDPNGPSGGMGPCGGDGGGAGGEGGGGEGGGGGGEGGGGGGD